MSTTYEIKPGTFKYIESEIYSHSENKKEIDRLRLAILNPTKPADENIVYGPLEKDYQLEQLKSWQHDYLRIRCYVT